MSTQQAFEALCDEIIAADFRRWPEFATASGVHEYDGQVTDHSPAAFQASIRERAGLVRRLEGTDAGGLDDRQRLDRALLLASMREGLIYDEQMRIHERSPAEALDRFGWGLLDLVRRNFAPAEHRMRDLVSRLEQFGKIAHDVRQRVTEPSAIPIDIALSSLKDTIPFFRDTLPRALPEVTDDALRTRLRDEAAKVCEECERLAAWLQEVKPDAHAPYAIGAEAYEASLKQAELVDLSLSKVLAAGEAELRRLTEEFTDTARRVDPSRPAREVYEDLAADHPPADKLIEFTESMLEDLRGFCVDKEILTFPGEDRCKVEPTPEFFRELTFASMDTPGPLEQTAREAYYNVTTPLPEWDEERTEQHMRAYNRWALASVSIHEAYPGHYTQFMWQYLWPSRVRKLYGGYSAAEGWAHYVEELFVELGYLDGDPRFKLGQLEEALLRACRYVVGIGLHTGEMTFEQGVRLFEENGHMEHVNAERETRRGTVDPMYCNYTLGKLMLLKLRADYLSAHPGAPLKQFHDAFLALGYPPIPLVRQSLLGEVGSIL
jgi:uncharacterized protein (DUF885 family)